MYISFPSSKLSARKIRLDLQEPVSGSRLDRLLVASGRRRQETRSGACRNTNTGPERVRCRGRIVAALHGREPDAAGAHVRVHGGNATAEVLDDVVAEMVAAHRYRKPMSGCLLHAT